MADNVMARKQPEAAGVNFPIELARDDKSVTAETPKDMADFMRAGYMPGVKVTAPTKEKKAKAAEAKKRSAKTRIRRPKAAK